MKNKWLTILMGSLFATALSLSAANAEIFTVDTFLGSQDLANSGDAAELAFIEGLTGDTLTQDFKIDSFTVSRDMADNPYIDIAPETTGFFVLKFGGGNFPSGTHNTYGFENIGELTKLVWTDGVVNNLSLDCTDGVTECRLSHYTGFSGGGGGGGGDPVPEPATILLFGSGLAGLGLWRWRNTKKA